MKGSRSRISASRARPVLAAAGTVAALLAPAGLLVFFVGFIQAMDRFVGAFSLTKYSFPITFCALPCRDGGIGRRTRFRSWRWQHCGGSSPLLGTRSIPSSLRFPLFI